MSCCTLYSINVVNGSWRRRFCMLLFCFVLLQMCVLRKHVLWIAVYLYQIQSSQPICRARKQQSNRIGRNLLCRCTICFQWFNWLQHLCMVSRHRTASGTDSIVTFASDQENFIQSALLHAGHCLLYTGLFLYQITKNLFRSTNVACWPHALL